MSHDKGRNVDPLRCGLWQGCDGDWYTSAGRCRVCGKTAVEHILSGLSSGKPESAVVAPLVSAPALEKSLLRVSGACRVVITRGCRNGGELDSDNLLGSCKKLRDEIARQILGLSDDADSSELQWEYRQAPGQGTLVEIYEVKE